MSKFAYSFGLITVGLAVGYLIQQLTLRGVLRLPMELDVLRKLLQKIALLFFMPVTVLGAIWIVDVPSVSIAALPVIGFGAITLGGILALLFARLFRLEPRQAGSLYGCGSFTNIGSIGALICFVFLGEEGFALVPIYKLFEEVNYYCIGFPIAKYFSTAESSNESALSRLKGLLRDPFILAALSSIIIGGLLNASGIPRPPVFKTVNAVFVPVGTSLLLISIGLAMRFRSVRNYIRECLAVASIKFLIVPVAATTVAWAIGYAHIAGGMPLKVVLILSAMPVAFNALIPPSIYDLDLDLANACWFFTTSCLVIVLPILLALIDRM